LKKHFSNFIGNDEMSNGIFNTFYDDVVFEIGLNGRFGEFGKDDGS
jgi:hypothetical protein